MTRKHFLFLVFSMSCAHRNNVVPSPWEPDLWKKNIPESISGKIHQDFVGKEEHYYIIASSKSVTLDCSQVYWETQKIGCFLRVNLAGTSFSFEFMGHGMPQKAAHWYQSQVKIFKKTNDRLKILFLTPTYLREDKKIVAHFKAIHGSHKCFDYLGEYKACGDLKIIEQPDDLWSD